MGFDEFWLQQLSQQARPTPCGPGFRGEAKYSSAGGGWLLGSGWAWPEPVSAGRTDLVPREESSRPPSPP